jgi:hypothetical protein
MRQTVGTALCLVLASLAAEAHDLLTILKSRYSDYQWDDSRTVSVDLNRDGAIDQAALGLQQAKVGLVLQIGGDTDPKVIEIPINAGKQFAICPGDEPKLEVRPQSEMPENAFGEKLPGYEICPECFEIVIDNGACDPLQFYWDMDSAELTWWRA